MGQVKLFEWLWGHHSEARKPTCNSLSSKEEKLREYREVVLDAHKQARTDHRGDPLVTWKVAVRDQRFPNYDITK